MANTLVQSTPSAVSRRRVTRTYTGRLTGSYVLGGEPLNPTLATDPNFVADPIAGIFDKPSVLAGDFSFRLDRAPSGYQGEINLATSPTGWNNALLLKLYTAPDTELAAGAYSVAIKADSFTFSISGPKGMF